MAAEPKPRRPSSSVLPAPMGFRSRRGSLASLSSHAPVDKETLSQALDEIHTTASRSEALTSFSDFEGGNTGRVSGAKDLVSGGISGLYSRLRQSVGGGGGSPESANRPLSRGSYGYGDTASVYSNNSSQPRSKQQRDSREFHFPQGVDKDEHVSKNSTPSKAANHGRTHSDAISEDRGGRNHSTTSSPAPDKRSTLSKDILTRGHVGAAPKDELTVPAIVGQLVSETKRLSVAAQQDVRKGATLELPRSAASSRAVSEDDTALLSDDESLDGFDVEATQAESKRVSLASRRSADTPDSKHEQISSRARIENMPKAQLQDGPSEAPFILGGPSIPSTANPSAPRRSLAFVDDKALPTVNVTRSSSAANSNDLLLSRASTAVSTPRSELDPPINLNANFRRQALKQPAGQSKSHAVVPAHLKRRVVSKEFWMKDENAKDCFYCGDAFSTFRRKHHCRTCGQIFDSKCTVLVAGRPFDLPGSLRLCKPCEGVIYGSDDDSTVFTDEDDGPRSKAQADVNSPRGQRDVSRETTTPFRPEDAALATPSMGIPASRRNREAKRRSAVIEFEAQPTLARPSSSRSLKSLSSRPRSSSHKRHPSRPQHLRTLKHLSEERGPFHQESTDAGQRQALPAFHNDNIIDPDLAPFMSDEGGSDDDQPSIFSVMNGGSQASSFVDHDRSGFVSSAAKKGRSRIQDRSGPASDRFRDPDLGRPPTRQGSKLRKRNTSIASNSIARPSPRRSRSQNVLFRDVDDNHRIDVPAIGALNFDELAPKALESKIKRSAAMHGAQAPRVELNRSSLQHVRKLLAQLLQDNKVPSWRPWEKALLPILLQCTDDVDPDVQRGDDMDVRNYIKLKKVPGGRPGDTTYVSGVVFSKHVALKGMKRTFIKPRVVIVTFAVEYARYNTHFMSLEPVIAQEREYLRNLVGRIAALKPQVLLVQRNVSGLALEMLQNAGITVVFNVKESVLAAVARVTRTIMIKSVDKLSIDASHLGQCDNFDVKTYIHSGVKKTYIYISGCQPSLGCTVVLRGAGTEVLRQVKRITEFMCYVVYNLRLETCLMRDEFVLIPHIDPNMHLASSADLPLSGRPLLQEARKAPSEKLESANESSAGEEMIMSPTKSRFAAETAETPVAVPAVDVPPNEYATEDESFSSQYRDLVQSARTRLLSSSPFVKFVEPYLLMQAQESERRVEDFKRLRDQYAPDTDTDPVASTEDKATDFELVAPEMIEDIPSEQMSSGMRRFLFDVHDVRYQRALIEYEAKKKQWESFFDGSNGNPFDPFTHQNIFVLQSLVSSVTSAPCAGPEVVGLSFYAAYEQEELNYDDDCTLGQFVEDLCMSAPTSCKACNRRMSDHHRQYVHGRGQLSVSVTRYPSKIKGLQNSILMWATCKVCSQETTVIPMSDSTWKYSFGKYLELSFWSTPLKPRAGLCPHDIHKDFIRCFGFHDQCVRVQHDSVELYDVLVPSSTINWAVANDLDLKNQLYSDCVVKLSSFIGSVKARLQSINLSTVAPEKSTDATAAVEKLMHRADDDKQALLDKMQDKYMSSRFYEVVPLNRAIRMLDEKALAWDEAFTTFERNYFPSETDIRRLATLQLKKLFLDHNEAAAAAAEHGEADGGGVEMKERPATGAIRLTEEEMQSEKAQDMLTSVVEAHNYLENVPTITTANSVAPTPVETARVDDLPSDNALMVRNLSPAETEKAVEREDVKHLDLAVPMIAPESPERTNHLLVPFAESPRSPTRPSTSDGVTETLTDQSFATEPKPLNSSLVERIEQIRSAASGDANNDGSIDSKIHDSKIPRLADLHRRAPGASPTLSRAQSQPGHVPTRSTDSTRSMPRSGPAQSGDASDNESPSRSHGSGDISRTVEQRLIDRLGAGQTKAAKPQGSLIPRSVPLKGANDNTTRVSALAKHFEQLSREFERERLRERRLRAARSRQNRAHHLTSSQPVVEVYRDASEAVGGRVDELRAPTASEQEQLLTSQTSDRRDHASAESQQKHELTDTTDTENTDQYTDNELAGSARGHGSSDTDAEATDTETLADMKQFDVPDPTSISSSSTLLSPSIVPDVDMSIPKHEKSSLMKMLSSFWSERSASGWSPLEYPLHSTEHVFEDSDIIVREDEPSSVIALALSSNDYLKKLREFRAVPRARGPYHASSMGDTRPDEDARQQAAIEASLISETGTHMKYSFGHNQVRAQCKIFYAESFDALRRKCGVSERFVESLSRSIKWDSKGGKTKSLFLKTLDDRFVIKSLQEVELKAFTRFAPDYFAFMSHTLFHGVPSVIAKMFGLFQVMMKNPATGVEFSSYLLVMENLFYDRKPNRRFDLKGSMRNRKIESTGQPDEVLLDENLVETIFETPLFVREHARKLVKASVWNDTLWLCKQNVMDYSLMAGFDDTAKTLTIGIIDCIRTYTWDKKLESWIKDRGKNKPTITSPKDYRNRFRVSMLQYVLQAPNCYHDFSRALPPPASLRMVEEQVRYARGVGADGGRGGVGELEAHFIDENAVMEIGAL